MAREVTPYEVKKKKRHLGRLFYATPDWRIARMGVGGGLPDDELDFADDFNTDARREIERLWDEHRVIEVPPGDSYRGGEPLPHVKITRGEDPRWFKHFRNELGTHGYSV